MSQQVNTIQRPDLYMFQQVGNLFDLESAEEKYRVLVENSPHGFMILRDGQMVFCNGAYAEILGYTIEELLVLSKEEFQQLIYPDDRDVVNAGFQDEGKSAVNLEYRMLRKDGTVIWMESRGAFVESDGISFFQAGCVDITARKQVEMERERFLEMFDLIINGLGDVIFVKNREQQITHVNKSFCRTFGVSSKDVVGKKVSELPPGVPCDLIYEEEKRVFETGEAYLYEREVVDSKGKRFFGLLKKTMARNRSGHELMVCSLRDVTEYRRMQEQIMRAQKMESLGRLTRSISHDFNNLLNVINGYSDLIMEELEEGNPIRGDVEKIRNAGLRAAELTSQLMFLRPMKDIQSELLNLNEVIEHCWPLLIRLIGDGIVFNTNLNPNLWVVQADSGQIQQIIMNLVDNARDAMPKGGALTVETQNVELDETDVWKHPSARPGRFVRVSCQDTGVGMDLETQSHLFEPFFSTKEKGKGAGLGLSSVYGIVKQNEGFIEVISAPETGTDIRIYLPVSMDNSK